MLCSAFVMDNGCLSSRDETVSDCNQLFLRRKLLLSLRVDGLASCPNRMVDLAALLGCTAKHPHHQNDPRRVTSATVRAFTGL